MVVTSSLHLSTTTHIHIVRHKNAEKDTEDEKSTKNKKQGFTQEWLKKNKEGVITYDNEEGNTEFEVIVCEDENIYAH